MRRFRRMLGVGAVAVLGVVTLVAVVAGTGTKTASAWWFWGRAQTATGAVPLTVPILGRANPSTIVPVTLSLQPRDEAGLQQRIAAEYTPGNPHYHQYLTPQSYAANYGPSAQQAAAVASFLRSQGMRNVTVSTNRLQVSAIATAAQAESAFATPLVAFAWNGRNYFANSAAATVPSSLSGVVTAVLGLTNLPVHTTSRTAIGAGSFELNQLATAYNGAQLAPANGQAIAVLGWGNMDQVVNNLRVAEDHNGLPHVPVDVVYTSGATTDTSGAEEWDLDTQVSTAIAGNVAKLIIYAGTGASATGLADPVNRFVSDDTAKMASASWGLCELEASLLGVKAAMEPAIQEAMAQGQSLFVSSGDNGSACNPLPINTNGIPLVGLPGAVIYPASSTYVTAVGGTSLTVNGSGDHAGESAWNAGGGGFAVTSPPGPWVGSSTTSGLGFVGSILKLFGGGRPVPDLAMDADPSTGANVYIGTGYASVGGTSLSAPMAMGAWARVTQAVGHNLGAAAPIAYHLYQTHPAGQNGFYDVTSGSIGLYSATAGWDPATGVGSMNMAQLASLLGAPVSP